MIRATKAYATLFWSLVPGAVMPWSDPCADPHDTVHLDGIDVDTAIAPLVTHLWSLNIDTHNCCQGEENLYALYKSRHAAHGHPEGNPYAAYVAFDNYAAAAALITILNPEDPAEISITARGRPPQTAWFAHFNPKLLRHWKNNRQSHAHNRQCLTA